MRFYKFLEEKINSLEIWDVLSFLGMVIYLAQSVFFAHTTIISLDEGGYLYKGLMFARGVYSPFQPYGFLMNKMPLAFLIPGWFQVIFGAGLRAGRYLAVLQGLLALIGLWLAARRLTGKAWAVLPVWVLVFSPAVIKVYSLAATQSLIACLLAWVLLLAVGKDRSTGQLVLASLLTAVMVMARQNMVAVFPLLILYIYWRHGIKKSAWAALAGFGAIAVGHVMYWPSIVQIWIYWLPDILVPAQLQNLQASGPSSWNPSVNIYGILLSMSDGIVWYFFTLTCFLLALVFFPKKNDLMEGETYKDLTFLAVLYGVLFGMHAAASLFGNYCTFCFSPYLAFFGGAGLLFVTMIIPKINFQAGLLRSSILIFAILLFSAAVGYSIFDESGYFFASLPVPRSLIPSEGFTSLGSIISNKFDLDPGSTRKISAVIGGGLIGTALILFASGVTAAFFKGRSAFPRVAAHLFLICGTLFSPFFSGHYARPDCEMDVIISNEKVGQYLADFIPPGSKVYWDGGLSFVPMLYVPQAIIYPPQVNSGYSFMLSSDSDKLLRLGQWNQELKEQWLGQSDIFVIEGKRYKNWETFLTGDRFEEYPRSEFSTSCLSNSNLRIFKRISP